MNQHPEVLIVGAGPTGLIAAIELRRRGIACRIIERRETPTDTSRAITVHARTMEILEDMGIAARFLHGGIPNEGYLFNFLGSDFKPRLDYTRLPTRYPFVVMFNQNQSEKILRDHLEHDLNLAIEWQTTLTELVEDDAGKITVTLAHGDGRDDELVNPEWVIACDGLHSPTRECVGISYGGSEYDLVMQMVDATLEGFTGADNLLHYYISEDTFLMIGKLEGPNYRVLVSSQGDAEEIAKTDLVTPVTNLHLPGVTIGDPDWKTTWEIWIRKAERFREGHVFLCGESGHIHSVAGGQGWNVSMQDAYNLAWKLAMVVRGQARESILDSYAIERTPVAEQVIEGSSAIHEIILAHGSGLEDRMALTQSEGWNDRAVMRISGLSYNYRGLIEVPDGCREGSEPAVGERVPDVALSPSLRLHELLAHTRFTLLILLDDLEPDSLELARAAFGRLNAGLKDVIRVELIAPQVPHPWPGLLPLADPDRAAATALNMLPGGEFILVRPDGYVGCRAPLSAFDGLVAFLGEFLTAQIQ